MKIEVLGFVGCPGVQATLALIKTELHSIGVSAPIIYREVDSVEEAQRVQFLGSPSVRVNGNDIELSRRQEEGYAFSCRIYREGEESSGLPPRHMVQAAILEALTKS